MATTKFYLDTRGLQPDKAAPLKIALMHKGRTALISLGVRLLPGQWNSAAEKVTGIPNRQAINTAIANRKLTLDNFIMQLAAEGGLNRLTAQDIKNRFLTDDAPQDKNLFAARFRRFADSKVGSTRTNYYSTYRRMEGYMGSRLAVLTFEDITKEWLIGFDNFLIPTTPSRNSRNVHLHRIRAVFNDAIDDGITAFYPFRRFKFRSVATPKRSLSVEQLRTFFDFPVEECQRKYQDMFKLIFFLCGINVVDLCRLKEVRDGRIEYNRAKTGRLYSIKVEPEAMAIIEAYRGKGQLLDMLDRYKDYKSYAHELNACISRIGPTLVGKHGKKSYRPLFPGLTTYWARHSWATIAASLDIPKEIIAAALGHGGNTVTDIYIDFDRRKVDEANRRVMDWVLYGRK